MWFIGKLSRDRRGAGSIIGAVFIVLILLSGFTFYTLNVNTTEHYEETLDSMKELNWNRNRENIVIKEIKITDTNKLNVTVENEGPILSHIIWLGIFNKTATPETQQYDALNVYVEPAETKNVASDVAVIEGKKYVIQLVTELGNIIQHKFYPASEVSCELTLITAPATAYEKNNVTVLLIVTHNDTEVDTIQNLTVSLEAEPAGLVEVKEEPTSLTVEGLQKVESAFFRWIYNTTITGTVTFNATYEQAPTGIYALSTVEIITSPAQSQYDFVDDNTSNEDDSDDKGTHSFFSAQQAGPDGIVDTLTEGGTEGENIENDVDRNDSNEDDSADKGTETNFANVQGSSLDSNYMNIQEVNTGDSGGSEWLDCNAFDSTWTSWTEVGSSPYLNAQDQPTNYIRRNYYYPSQNEGWFDFPDTTLTGTLRVNISVYCNNDDGAGNERADVYVDYTGTGSGSLVGSVAQHTSWQYDTIDLGSHTVSEVNNLRVYFRWVGYGTPDDVRIDHVHIGVSSPASPNYEIDFEYKWTTAAYSSDNEEICIYVGAHAGSETLNVNYWSGSWTLLGTITSTGWNNFTATGLTSAIYTIQLIGATESGDGDQDDWNIDLITLHTWNASSYELDLEVRWTDVDHDETNEWLCIYGGTMGSEDILVDVWNGATWINLFTDLSSGWNSVDISSYLDSSTFTIRYRSIADAIQADEWEIDAAFLYVWT